MISIAMATYNGAKFIREQIDSILVQTIQDFELVICDDCSTDETSDILQTYAKEDLRIRTYRNEKNMGFKRNFELALKLTHGDYIALCDQDDVWTPDHLSSLYEQAKTGTKLLVCGGSELVDTKGGDLERTLFWAESYDRITNDEIENAYTLLFFRNPFQGASMMIRREFLDYALPIPNGVGYHDAWFSALAWERFNPVKAQN